jgi:hypothetical protein
MVYLTRKKCRDENIELEIDWYPLTMLSPAQRRSRSPWLKRYQDKIPTIGVNDGSQCLGMKREIRILLDEACKFLNSFINRKMSRSSRRIWINENENDVLLFTSTEPMQRIDHSCQRVPTKSCMKKGWIPPPPPPPTKKPMVIQMIPKWRPRPVAALPPPPMERRGNEFPLFCLYYFAKILNFFKKRRGNEESPHWIVPWIHRGGFFFNGGT